MELTEKIQDYFFQWFIDRPHTLRGLLTIMVIVTSFFLTIHLVIKNDFNYEWILYGVIYLLIFTWWLMFKFYYPRNNKKQTGLVIALYSDDPEALKLKKKFIRELRKNINSASLHKIFKIIELKNHQAEFVENIDDIKKIDKKIDGHLYLFGDIQKEPDGDVVKYYINLEGYVAHQPVAIALSRQLSFDFRNVLPKEINFVDLFGYRCIKATSKMAYLATRYVVGVASFMSGNPFLAYELHTNLEIEFKEYEDIKKEIGKGKGEITKFDQKYLRKLRKKVLKIISNEALTIAKIFYLDNKFDDCIRYLQIAELKNPENYGVWLFKAIIAFQSHLDVPSAMAYIKKAEKFSNGSNEWRYSKAFLFFWEEKLVEAYRECQKIAECSYSNEHLTVNEVEGFNIKILESNNQKPQLYFWLGYLILKKRNDPLLAKAYLEKFLAGNAGNRRFLEEKARSFLIELEKQQAKL